MSDVRVEEIHSLESFQQLKAPWDDLCRRSIDCFPMLAHTWLGAWWKAFGADMELRILVAWRGETLIGAAPMALAQERLFRKKRRVLRVLANAWVDRMHWLLAARPGDGAEAVDALLAHLEREGGFDLIDLFPLDEASAQTTLLLDGLKRRGWNVGVEPHLRSPTLALPESWDALIESLSSSYRQTVRRKIRKVESMPGVTTRVVRDESCWPAIETISRESWQEEEGTSMVSQPQIREFYSTVIRAAAADGTLRCAVMEVDGEPAAFEFNLVHRKTLHNFKLGFRKKYGELSSGIVLKSHLLKEVLDGGDVALDEYDFMGTAEPYKLNWTKKVRAHNRYYLFAKRWDMDLVYRAFFVVKPLIRKVARKMARKLRKAKGAVAHGA